MPRPGPTLAAEFLINLLYDRRLRIVSAAIVLSITLAAGAGHAVSSSPIGRHLLDSRGFRVYFENRPYPDCWGSGEVVQQLATDEAMQREIGLQLDRIRAMGGNEIAFALFAVAR
jgi:hypothetical protein